MAPIKRMEEKSQIQLDIEQIPDASYNEKINLLFAGGDLPDVILYFAPSDLLNYTSLLRSLNGYMDNYMPNLRAFLSSAQITARCSSFLTAKFTNCRWLPKMRITKAQPSCLSTKNGSMR